MDNNNKNDRDSSIDDMFSEDTSRGSYSFERERAGYNRSNAMRREKVRKNKVKKTVLMISVIVLLSALWIVCAFAIVRTVLVTDTVREDTSQVTEQIAGENGSDNPNESQDLPQAFGYKTESMGAEDYKKGKLILINSTYKYDQKSDTALKSELVEVFYRNNGTYIVAAQENKRVRLRLDTVNSLNDMFSAFKAETGLSGYCLRDDYGYCTTEDQQGWFEMYEAKYGAGAVNYEFRGGESEHEAGRTFDLKVQLNEGVFISSAKETEAKYSWIYDNCYKYGIIDRYPSDKKDITGIEMKEGATLHCDHFRYVGVAAATAMHENNWCLEEFLVKIQDYSYNGEHLKVTGADGTSYEMYYYPAVIGSATEVKVPESLVYEISGDNIGGYIVTVTMNKSE